MLQDIILCLFHYIKIYIIKLLRKVVAYINYVAEGLLVAIQLYEAVLKPFNESSSAFRHF